MLKFTASSPWLPVALVAWTALCSHPVASPSALAQGAGETLLVSPPDGFKVGWQKKDERLQMVELVPSEESVENWSEMITVQIFFGARRVDPGNALNQVRVGWTTACPGGNGDISEARMDGGYPVATARMACPLNPKTGKPETAWMKAIAGNDSLYLVQRAVRAAPSTDQDKTATDYLATVRVCDPRRADQFC